MTAGEKVPTLSVVDGHYPGFRELVGLDFRVSVVMSAADMTWDQGIFREDQLQRLALAWNSYDALQQRAAGLEAREKVLREVLADADAVLEDWIGILLANGLRHSVIDGEAVRTKIAALAAGAQPHE